ncbi:unnamed protein product [Owenia fusiformis]|uniref:Uncharacterized protein n=1 Tax=Owenia fusiformis TaxID=6347 RepID=A0A8J1UNI4_OWEFU|nr:unnamed protein product [Owenia fusiformis]
MANQISEASSEEYDFTDMMEVVTSYKCLFCAFTSTIPTEVNKHVKRVHSQNIRHTRAVANVVPEQPPQIVEDSETIIEVTEAHEPEETVMSQEISENTNSGMAIHSDGSDTQHQTLIVEANEDNPMQIVEDVTRNEHIDVVTTDGATASIPLLTLSNGKSIAVMSDSSTQVTSGSDQTDSISRELPEGSVRLIDESEQNKMENTPLVQNFGSQVESDQSSETSKNKDELFLCGQCSLGFPNIDDCKAHMITDHGFNISASMESSSGKVDTGTQMEPKKKPGRKRKDEEAELTIIKDEPEQEQEIYKTASGRRTKRPRKNEYHFYDYSKRRKHYEEATELKSKYMLQCPWKCGAKFCSNEGLQIHVECHMEKNVGDGFMCSVCKQEFPRWPPCRIHLYKQHNIDADMQTCDVCQFKTDCIGKLLTHKEIHSETRPYKCSVCDKGFKQLAQMKNHEVFHRQKPDYIEDEKKDKKWYDNRKCNICNTIFANYKTLKIHIEIVHEKLKPYQCPYCEHQSSRKAMLDLHVRGHTGEKPYKCEFCEYATGDHNCLRRHKMRHTGEKPYKCAYCPYTCIQAISLKTHMQNKHNNEGPGVFACDLCSYRTVNANSWERHKNDHKCGLIETVSVHGNQNQQEQQSQQPRPAISLETAEDVEKAQQEGQLIQVEVTAATDDNQQVQLIQPIDQVDAAAIAGLQQAEAAPYAQVDINAAQLIYSALNHLSQSTDVKAKTENENEPTMVTIQFAEGHTMEAPSRILSSLDMSGERVYLVADDSHNNEVNLSAQPSTVNAQDVGIDVQTSTINAQDVGINVHTSTINAQDVGINAQDVDIDVQTSTINAQDVGINVQDVAVNIQNSNINFETENKSEHLRTLVTQAGSITAKHEQVVEILDKVQ